MLKTMRSPLLAVAFVIGLAGAAVATPGSGFAGTILSTGTHSESVHYNTGEVKFQTKAAVDFVNQTITIAPSGTSGWHTHPGVVLVTVVSGELIRYAADCSSTILPAGSAFTESGDHAGLVRNTSSTASALVHVTYVVPDGTPPSGLRIDAANPGCPGLG